MAPELGWYAPGVHTPHVASLNSLALDATKKPGPQIVAGVHTLSLTVVADMLSNAVPTMHGALCASHTCPLPQYLAAHVHAWVPGPVRLQCPSS